MYIYIIYIYNIYIYNIYIYIIYIYVYIYIYIHTHTHTHTPTIAIGENTMQRVAFRLKMEASRVRGPACWVLPSVVKIYDPESPMVVRERASLSINPESSSSSSSSSTIFFINNAQKILAIYGSTLAFVLMCHEANHLFDFCFM